MDNVSALIRDFFERLGIAIERIEEDSIGPQKLFRVHSPDSALLIGGGGETLRALNHIIRKLQERTLAKDEAAEERPPFLIDVNGYQAKRIKELHDSARLLAERARLFQHDVEMPPMAPYERMIVHAFLSEYPDVATQSSGEGKFRRVVIRFGKSQEESKISK